MGKGEVFVSNGECPFLLSFYIYLNTLSLPSHLQPGGKGKSLEEFGLFLPFLYYGALDHNGNCDEKKGEGNKRCVDHKGY